MPRPKRDGGKSRPTRKRALTDKIVRELKEEPAAAYYVGDIACPDLLVRVYPSGRRSLYFRYRRRGSPKYFKFGLIEVAEARKLAAKLQLSVLEGRDPVAERDAQRNAGTFAELADRYVTEYAKKRNKSWTQAEYLIRKYVLPSWGGLPANTIARRDVRAMLGRIASTSVGNQVLAACSAIFTWAVKMEVIAFNPCRGVDRNATQDRERILSDSELPKFWKALDAIDPIRAAALKCILLLGQRPGEISHMRVEHIDDCGAFPARPSPRPAGREQRISDLTQFGCQSRCRPSSQRRATKLSTGLRSARVVRQSRGSTPPCARSALASDSTLR